MVIVMKQVIAVYSETGGATKTTTAVSLAVCSALLGHATDLIDLDPRGAATKWLGVTPAEDWQHVGAILGNADPIGWVNDLALPSPWEEVPGLRVVPSSRSLSNREAVVEDHSDVRLRLALDGTTAAVTILDLPNRQGGPLIQNALTAATKVVYAAKLDEDGLDGVDGAAMSVRRYRQHRVQLGAPVSLIEAGIIVGSVRETVMTMDARRALSELTKSYGELVLDPLVPERVIVREARAAGRYYGFFDKGSVVHDAYLTLTRKVLDA